MIFLSLAFGKYRDIMHKFNPLPQTFTLPTAAAPTAYGKGRKKSLTPTRQMVLPFMFICISTSLSTITPHPCTREQTGMTIDEQAIVIGVESFIPETAR